HLAFNLADKYRNPVYVLVDGVIGQMMEPVNISKLKNEKFWCPADESYIDRRKATPNLFLFHS
ncbi:MAG: 3-methyl-2-oxobutanoate dehydrogenase subunit beta, partial [Candidatus Woesebacteria bacterium]|nr:3-methyl-2-oxobutanoate dehydrogenase subunit beta [Candidatus Woesebacteria bacterium]